MICFLFIDLSDPVSENNLLTTCQFGLAPALRMTRSIEEKLQIFLVLAG